MGDGGLGGVPSERNEYELNAEPGRYEIHGSDAGLGLLVPLARLYYGFALRAARHGVSFGTGAIEWSASAYVAVFFACAAAEAYLPELANTRPARAHGVDEAKLRLALREWEDRQPIELAFAAGEPEPEANEWYRRLRCLRKLRSELVHFKARAHALDQWPRRLTDPAHECRTVIQGWVPGAHDWTSQLLVPAVAVWACDTVRVAIEGLHARVGGAHPWADSVPLGERWPQVGPTA